MLLPYLCSYIWRIHYYAWSRKTLASGMMALDGKEWKKLEDDIIKAGIMKYGTNKWSKISTLLQKRTPKQCKERWKLISPENTKFSEEEILKLLDMAKTFPNQWTMVAKCLNNKSPRQCYDMYQRILAEEAVQDSVLEMNNPLCLEKKRKLENAEEKVFDKKTGRFDVIPTKDSNFIVRNNKLLHQREIDYSGLSKEERELAELARARLENTKGRKDLKKKLAKRREEQRRLMNKTAQKKDNA